VDVVPLHGDVVEGVGVRGGVGGPVVEPGDFGAGSGEGVDFVLAVVGGWPAEASLAWGGHGGVMGWLCVEVMGVDEGED